LECSVIVLICKAVGVTESIHRVEGLARDATADGKEAISNATAISTSWAIYATKEVGIIVLSC
jgi:hypothetical protein